jgi:hypothetical protein
MRSFAVLLVEMVFGAVVCPIGLGACESSKTTVSSAASSGGESSTGGDNTGGDTLDNVSGGASNTGGGATGGSIGSGGANSTGGAAGCVAPATVPEALMTNFSEIADGSSTSGGTQLKWGTSKSLTGGTFVYGQDSTGADTPLGTITGGALNITANVASGHYGGIGFYFGPNCGSDACAFSGFSFSVAGSTGGADVDIQMQQVSNYPLNDNGKGTCDYVAAGYSSDTMWNYCTNPHVRLSTPLPDGVTTDPQVVQVPWTALTGGNPVSELDCAKLLGIQIQFNGVSGSCAVNLTIDDLAFYQ